MIPYEELVAALRSWRERNGLPVGSAAILPSVSVPPLTPAAGDAAAGGAAIGTYELGEDAGVEQVYDLSDDSGLIEAEVPPDEPAGAAWGEPAYGEEVVGGEAYGEDAFAAADDRPAAFGDAGSFDPAERAFTENDGYGAEDAPFDPHATHEVPGAGPQSGEETYIGQAPEFPGQLPDEDALTAIAHAPEPPAPEPAFASEHSPEHGDPESVEIADEAIFAEQADEAIFAEQEHPGFEDAEPDEATQIHQASEYADHAPVDISPGDVLTEVEEDEHGSDRNPRGGR